MNSAAERAPIAIEEALERARAGATLVTASRRLARALRERTNVAERARGRAVWSPPTILSWAAWLDELWTELIFSGAADAVRLDENQERAVWERAIRSSEGASALLDVAATAGACAWSWKLMQDWRIDAAAVRTHATEDSEAFLVWAREFDSICRREGWIDGTRSVELLPSPLAGPVVLAGFDELTPQQESFLAGSQVSVAAPASVKPRAVRTAFEDRDAEIAAAARWARSLAESGATDIAVLFPDLAEIRPRVERTFLQVFGRPAFNIAASPALDSYPLVSAALLALELAPESSEFALVSRLLRSPFLDGGDTEWTARAKLDAELRRFGSDRVSVARLALLAERGCPQLAALLAGWRSERESVPAAQAPDRWARTFSSLLAKLGWPGERALASAGYQTVAKWREMLSGFARLGVVIPEMTYSEALARLRRLAAATEFQPETGAAPVQILGLLETSGMEFGHLWIAGLDDERWPAPARPAPFLPVALQRLRGMPRSSPERMLAFAQRTTGRLLASAPDIVVSYARRDADRELAPSPLILDIPEDQIDLPSYPLYPDVVRESSLLESIEDHTAPPFSDAAAPGGTRVFEFQAQCPFRAFAELRLGAEPLETPAPGLDPAERGTLVHRALEAVWGALKSHQRLCACGEAELAAIVRASIAPAMDWIAAKRGTLPAKLAAIERVRIERLVLEWLAIERQRASFTVVEFESARRAEAGGVLCKVKVDRVDRLDDGREVIIDYKTGRQTVRAWEGDRPDAPQLPLYAISHAQPVAAVLFGQVRVGETGFKGYAAGDGVAPGAETREMDSVLDGWRTALDRLGADFRAGVANVDPKDARACRRCSLAPLCRFAESETPASAFDEGNGNA
jgi:ATP-dependent helicase/nuclease subunit B